MYRLAAVAKQGPARFNQLEMTMPSLSALPHDSGRRNLLMGAAAMAGAAPLGMAVAQPVRSGMPDHPQPQPARRSHAGMGTGLVGYMLAHEQFPVQELIGIANNAANGGFHLLATSDHFQPWQANEAHSGEAWVTLGALSAQVLRAWMGTTVTPSRSPGLVWSIRTP